MKRSLTKKMRKNYGKTLALKWWNYLKGLQVVGITLGLNLLFCLISFLRGGQYVLANLVVQYSEVIHIVASISWLA